MKNNDRPEPQCAAFYLALIGRLFSDAALDFKMRLLHANRAVNDAIAEKSYFALNGAMDRQRDSAMKTMSAREAKNGFGLMIDTARAEPVLIEKHGRGVVVVVSVEEYERLSVQAGRADKGETGTKGASKGGQ